MKQKQTTTQGELLNQGWKQIDTYSIYEIWAKDDDRLLFDPIKKIIYLTY